MVRLKEVWGESGLEASLEIQMSAYVAECLTWFLQAISRFASGSADKLTKSGIARIEPLEWMAQTYILVSNSFEFGW
ncbi:hypothetical protein V6N12_007130 [Hibiscus sabdariffa]|uniref:Exocyst subunit Exo70 family protein n=1 Tax=Hibiscus sabdariffa TaxID=183260 RepID=A0ABR2F0W6_9ROSI